MNYHYTPAPGFGPHNNEETTAMNNGMNQGMNNGHVYNNHKNDGESWWTKTPKRNVVEKWIGGVCAGLGDYFGISATLVRLLMVASLLLPGPQILFYIAAWVIMPADKPWVN